MRKALLIVSVAVFGLSFGGGEGTKDKTVLAVDTAATVATATDTDDDINESETPYEATWMKLTKKGNSYVVYNYLDWYYTPDTDDEKYRTPTIIRVHGNQLTYIYYHEAPSIELFDTVERKDNDVYSFQITKFKQVGDSSFRESNSTYSFQWIDKRKHIAKWIVSYDHYGENVITDSSSIYIDSAYNKYPIVNYVWKSTRATRESDD